MGKESLQSTIIVKGRTLKEASDVNIRSRRVYGWFSDGTGDRQAGRRSTEQAGAGRAGQASPVR